VRQRTLRDLFPHLETAQGMELLELRTRIAQELRSTLSQVTFTEHSIMITHRTPSVLRLG
jgi:hypothetical protein